MTSWKLILVVAAFMMGASHPTHALTKSKLRSLIKSGYYKQALGELSKSQRPSASQYFLRADLFNKLGYYHLDLAQRIEGLKKNPSFKHLHRAGNTALVLGRYDSLVSLVSRLPSASRRSLPVTVRLVQAAHSLRKGDLRSAIRYLPPANSIEQMSFGLPRYEGAAIGATINYGLRKNSTALSYLSRAFPKVKNADLGHLRLLRAQIYYDMRDFDRALSEVSEINRSSPSWFDGALVSAWGAYLSRDYNLALGQLMNLNSPYLVSKFNPESYLLQSAVLYQLCYFESALRAVNKFKEKYQKMDRSFRSFESLLQDRKRFMKVVGEYARGRKQSRFGIPQEHWILILDGLSSEKYMGQLDRSLNQLEKENQVLRKDRQLARYRRIFQSEYKYAQREYFESARNGAKKRLRRMKDMVKESLEGALSVELEVNTRLRDRLISGSVARRRQIDFDKEIAKGYEFWPFEGEFWRDETGYYAFATGSVCEERR